MKAYPASLLRHLSGLGGSPSNVSDVALLDFFVRQRDERAFAALVARHGPMVLRVCRRVLGNAADADDAFQAAFLVLARKAGAIRQRDSLAAWLHGVAHRLALKARATIGRRRCLEMQPAGSNPADDHADPLARVSARELLTILDTELARLPAKYRAPLILCCMEGRTLQEVAQQLGWTIGSVKGHLERGRKRLHGRLLRRGVSLTAALAAAYLATEPGAAMSAALAKAVVKNGLLFASDKQAVGITNTVAMLAHGALKEMFMSKVKFVTAMVLMVGVAVLAVSTLAHQASGKTQSPPPVVGDQWQGSDPGPARPHPVAHLAPALEEKPPPKPIVTVNGEHSKIVKEKVLRITSKEDWEALWGEHKYGPELKDKPSSGAESVELDFDKVMAIVVFEGQRAQCRGYVVDSIIENEDSITVRTNALTYQVAGSGDFTSEAWGVFIIPKSNKEVVVERDVRTLKADPPKWKEWKKFAEISDK